MYKLTQFNLSSEEINRVISKRWCNLYYLESVQTMRNAPGKLGCTRHNENNRMPRSPVGSEVAFSVKELRNVFQTSPYWLEDQRLARSKQDWMWRACRKIGAEVALESGTANQPNPYFARSGVRKWNWSRVVWIVLCDVISARPPGKGGQQATAVLGSANKTHHSVYYNISRHTGGGARSVVVGHLRFMHW